MALCWNQRVKSLEKRGILIHTKFGNTIKVIIHFSFSHRITIFFYLSWDQGKNDYLRVFTLVAKSDRSLSRPDCRPDLAWINLNEYDQIYSFSYSNAAYS